VGQEAEAEAEGFRGYTGDCCSILAGFGARKPTGYACSEMRKGPGGSLFLRELVQLYLKSGPHGKGGDCLPTAGEEDERASPQEKQLNEIATQLTTSLGLPMMPTPSSEEERRHSKAEARARRSHSTAVSPQQLAKALECDIRRMRSGTVIADTREEFEAQLSKLGRDKERKRPPPPDN